MDKPEIIQQLKDSGCSCLIARGEQIVKCHKRGVADIHRLLTDGSDILRGAFVADKVVGKAAASLMILGGVAELHALVISRHALDLISRSSLVCTCDEVVDHIINRSGNDWCPMEKLCRDLATPEECFPVIDAFVKSLK